MSTSYGAPIEVFSVDPWSSAQTELADTSATNLLAELPVLETEAGGANLGLQLADGTQVQFASTARLATFLYSLAVQQMQATSFVTDDYNLDMQWLNTTDQPLLVEADYWSKLAAATANPEQSIEDNVEASLALQIAAEAPSSRQDMEETINNAATGNPTQITVYAAGGGGKVHDISGGIGGIFESIASIVVNIAAAVFPETGLPYLAAALDAASAGQDFSNGQDLQGVLNLAEAVANGINGVAGANTPTAQVISTASQAVGGVYGIVQSAQNGNAAGILAGALEAAAAAAAGIGMAYGDSTQTTLNQLAAALGTAGVATTMASAFASGNVGQGLVDSLNLFLPAVAQAFENDQTGQANLQAPLETNAAAFEAATAEASTLPNYSTAIQQAIAAAAPTSSASGQTGAPTQYGFTINTTAFANAVAAASPNGAPSFNSAISPLSTATTPPAGGISETVPINGTSWQLMFSPASPTATGAGSNIDVTAVAAPAAANQSGGSTANGSQSTLNTIQATLAGIGDDVMSFLAYINPIGAAEAATPGGAQATSATAASGVVTYANSDGSSDIYTGGTAAWRNNNPGNMIAGAGAYQPIGSNTFVKGTDAIFPDFQTGWNAMIANLQSSSYVNLPISDAIQKWVGVGVVGSNPANTMGVPPALPGRQ